MASPRQGQLDITGLLHLASLHIPGPARRAPGP